MSLLLFAASEAQVMSEPLINWGDLIFPIAVLIVYFVMAREPKKTKPKKEAKR